MDKVDALYNLTPRVQLAAFYVSQGCDKIEIMERMNISESTVQTQYFARIYRALGIQKGLGRGTAQIRAVRMIRKLIE